MKSNAIDGDNSGEGAGNSGVEEESVKNESENNEETKIDADKTDASNNTPLSESDDSDDFDSDEFGDFEGGEDEQEETIESKEPLKETFRYDGDYSSHANEIEALVKRIMNFDIKSEEEEKPESEVHGIVLDDRCQKTYARLMEKPHNLQQLNWKKSFIRRQLLLNLQIPIDLDEVSDRTQQQLEESRRKYKEDIEERKAIQKRLELQILPFKDVGISKEKAKTIIDDTDAKLEIFYRDLQSVTYYKTLEKQKPQELKDAERRLANIKQELLVMISCWNERIKAAKADSDLFSSYVENLVGNTQKLRRDRKIRRQSKK